MALYSLFAQAMQFDSTLERKLFDLANAERAKERLPALEWSDKLAEAARLHAEKMAAEKKLSHGLAGEAQLFDRVAATGLHFNLAAENVAFATEFEDLHPGWMNSPGHRANVLSSKSNAVGVAVLKVASGYYAVQDFAHTNSSDSPPAAEKRFIQAFDAARGSRKPRVKISQPATLREAASEMAKKDDVNVKGTPIPKGFLRALAFTTFEPEELPSQMKELASDSSLQEMEVGACFRVTPHFAGGVYWFIVIY